jgi:hypothetical protein
MERRTGSSACCGLCGIECPGKPCNTVLFVCADKGHGSAVEYTTVSSEKESTCIPYVITCA